MLIQSRVGPFEMAKVVTLVHPNVTLQAPAKLLMSKCDLFADDPGLATLPYHMKLTNNDFRGLLELCEEFCF
jgi:hypothetical protein